MTEKELSQLYYLNRETERLQKDLEELTQWGGYRSQVVNGMPKGGIRRDISDVAVEITELRELIQLNLKRIQLERARLERFIGSVEDSEMRLIIRLRHINGMTWEAIAAEINLERTTVSKKYKAYLKDSHISR